MIQLLADVPSIDVLIRMHVARILAAPMPWIATNARDVTVCLMCPMPEPDRYLGVSSRAPRAKRVRWLYAHRRCGFMHG